MKVKDKRMVSGCVEAEGFDYCFWSYSHFPEVKDDEFHKLRQEYINAARKLKNYIGCD